MSEESLDICRLCSAPDHLICMFTGKQRDVRNSLRKMIKETVNIQVEILVLKLLLQLVYLYPAPSSKIAIHNL